MSSRRRIALSQAQGRANFDSQNVPIKSGIYAQRNRVSGQFALQQS
jgi:hypothetical protein